MGNSRNRSIIFSYMKADDWILRLPTVELRNRESLLKVAGIYYIIDDSNLVWYIGKANDLFSRWKGKAHHRFFQLNSHTKKKFFIYYHIVDKNQLDDVERREIAKYNPHLNESSVKKKNIIPTETLLRETLIKLYDYIIILGIEPPRASNIDLVNQCTLYQEKWWIQKKIIDLSVIHIGIDINKLDKFTSNYEAVQGIFNSIFNSRKAYANKWQLPPSIKKIKYLSIGYTTRLLVNGYAIEISPIYGSGATALLSQTEKLTLSSENIKVLNESAVNELKIKGIKTYMGIFLEENKIYQVPSRPGRLIISRIQPYTKDPISLIFKESLKMAELENYLTKIKKEYDEGRRGIGSRTRFIDELE